MAGKLPINLSNAQMMYINSVFDTYRNAEKKDPGIINQLITDPKARMYAFGDVSPKQAYEMLMDMGGLPRPAAKPVSSTQKLADGNVKIKGTTNFGLNTDPVLVKSIGGGEAKNVAQATTGPILQIKSRLGELLSKPNMTPDDVLEIEKLAAKEQELIQRPGSIKVDPNQSPEVKGVGNISSENLGKSRKNTGSNLVEAEEGILGKIDRFTARPIRNAVGALIEGENPLEAAKQGLVGDKNTEGKDLARKFLSGVQQRGLKLSANTADPLTGEIEEDKMLLETPLGMVADNALDITNAIPGGAPMKATSKLTNFFRKAK